MPVANVKSGWVSGNLVFQEAVAGNGAAVHFGIDGTGLDVKFFGDTASAYMLWDESADALLLAGDSRLDLSSATVKATNTDGGVIKCGTSAAPVTEDTANMKFMAFYFDNGATSGDNRGMYLRQYLTGAGGGGEAARIFTTCEDVACGTAHGAHISLNFGDTGSVTGLGVAMRGTLHVPDDASWAPGTVSSLQAEIYSDGSDSDTDGATEVSFIRVVNAGHADGIADVDDDAFLLSIQGGSIASGNMVQTENDETKFSHKIRCKVGTTTLYLMACDS